MGHYTEYTARWLDRRYARRTEDGLHLAHMPIYGVGHPACERRHVLRLARMFQVLRILGELAFKTFLDVGGGEGYLSYLVREHLGARVSSCDLSTAAGQCARQLFGVDAVAADCARLPFADDSFDVVLCAEMIEHVEFPIEALLELERVARLAVIVTTEELELDRAVIARRLFERCGYPHYDRNLFHPDDLRLLYGDGIDMRSQLMLGDDEPGDDAGIEAMRAWISRAAPRDGLVAGGLGVVVLHALDESVHAAAPRWSDAELLDRLLTRSQVVARPLPNPPVPRRRAPLGCHHVALDPSAEELAARLAAHWRDDTARVAATLALRDRLVMPNAPDRLRWDFREPEARRGWMPGRSMIALPSDGGGLRYRATDADPWLASPGLAVPADRLAHVELRMRIHNPDFPVDSGRGQLFWLGESDDDLDERHSVLFPVVNDNAVHTYRVDPRAQPAWPRGERVLFLRIDPANGPCELELYGVTLHLDG